MNHILALLTPKMAPAVKPMTIPTTRKAKSISEVGTGEERQSQPALVEIVDHIGVDTCEDETDNGENKKNHAPVHASLFSGVPGGIDPQFTWSESCWSCHVVARTGTLR